MTSTPRPSRTIYLRNDARQVWRDCESPYEMGYRSAEADVEAGLPAMTGAEHDDLWGLWSDYAEGYTDCYADLKATITNNQQG